jgi:drug/metabolite transporter superfamily protein YnfA
MATFIVELLKRFQDARKAGRTLTAFAGAVIIVSQVDDRVVGDVLSGNEETIVAGLVLAAVEYLWRKVRARYFPEPEPVNPSTGYFPG